MTNIDDKKNKIIGNGLTRREFLGGLAAAAAVASLKSTDSIGPTQFKGGRRTSICIFSKNLQWLDYKGMAETTAEIGFDGVDLTVRPGGHVLPERAEDDLPKAAEAVKKAGIEISMMTTSITDPDNPNTEKILRTASQLGIRYYRLGYLHYSEEKGILEQLEELKPKMRDLAAMNRQYKIFGGNHNHVGNYIGASLWDEWELFKDIDPEWTGFQFDIEDAFTEGNGGSWLVNTRLVIPRVKILALKTQAEWEDPEWKKNIRKSGKSGKILTPDELIWYFRLLKKTGFSGPISTIYEFPLGGAENGRREIIGMTKEDVLKILRRNLKILQEMLSKAELI